MGIKRHIPNTITSMNLFCGVLGVISAMNGALDNAFIWMLIGAVCDFFDGLVARALKVSSAIGKELDSLADMCTFGILPAIMLHKTLVLAGQPIYINLIPLVIAVFSGLRLAKFNTDERQTENFIGLATPSCAMICGGSAMFVSLHADGILASLMSNAWFTPLVSIVLALLLVSEIPMFSMKLKKHEKRNRNDILRIVFFILVTVNLAFLCFSFRYWPALISLTFVEYIVINIFSALFPEKK